MSLSPKGRNIMEAVFHMGKDSNRYLREFSEKRVDFAVQELRNYGANELKVLLRTFQEENRTFDEKARVSYN